MIGFHWVAYTAHAFGNLPWSVSGAALLLFAAFVHLHIPAALVLVNWVRGNKSWPTWAVFLAYALTTSLIERIWPMIFSWHMGYSLLYSKLQIYQLAEWVGFAGLSTWLLLLNVLMATGLWFWNHKKAHAALLMTASVLSYLVLNITGSVIRPKADQSLPTIKALIVQANVGQFEKIAAEKHVKGSEGELQRAVQQTYFELTDEALRQYPEAEVIIWPETALADYLDIEYLSRPRQLELRSKIQSWNRAVITGAYSRTINTNDVYNAIFAFNHKGELAASAYKKSQLLAFGEYLPGSETFPALLKLFPFVSNFARGAGPEIKPIEVPNKKFQMAPQICYESLSPEHSRQGALMGGELLVNTTNDSWFGQKFEPFQHGTMTWARAIETRRPLIRSTNTGQSSIIDHTGQVLVKSTIGEKWYGMAEVPVPQKTTTFYMKYGYLDWVLYLVILLILTWRMKRRENTNRSL